ncbi:MAG TPA: phosphoribosylanthranilate isomerase [Blastocatellia bacterium]|nr:phosphoribosylanthranilate isomerase [Blastocatellia bacterium]
MIRLLKESFMNRVKVKICGIRSLEEAEAAVEAGADALGFNFWPGSPRYSTTESAREIITSLSPLVANIGVFVNETQRAIEAIATDLRLAAVQLHGDESRAFCAGITAAKTIKAIRVTEAFEPNSIKCYPASMILLDAGLSGSYGGTGKTFDWSVAVECAGLARIMLAGGLTAENVGEAIAKVRPAAIDVCSGVESEPGRKDLAKLRDFMRAVTKANSKLPHAGRVQCL